MTRQCWTTLTVIWMMMMMLVGLIASHEDCGAPDPTDNERARIQKADVEFLGHSLSDMKVVDFSNVLQSMLVDDETKAAIDSKTLGNSLRPRLRPFRLVNVPLVYHVLPKQGVGVRRPSMTNAQREHATDMTTQRYNIYDKESKQSVQFVSFVTNDTIVHSNFSSTTDCISLSSSALSSIVTKAVDWQFKMHVVVCEFGTASGVATLPLSYRASDPQHNLLRVDHRALACSDDDGKFLCDLTDGKPVSHSRWWRSRSVVLAHEIGHLFGLTHTFSGGCLSLDRIADTPAERGRTPEGCPGLLPYDKDRSLYQYSNRKALNSVGTNNTCVRGGADTVCGSTCAACCEPDVGSESCSFDFPNGESITEALVDSPICCKESQPRDSCKLRRGIDPLNNFMSYAPDFCSNEFTVGQMVRMMAQIRRFKPYIYCNFSDQKDDGRCSDVPCFKGAISPNCQ